MSGLGQPHAVLGHHIIQRRRWDGIDGEGPLDLAAGSTVRDDPDRRDVGLEAQGAVHDLIHHGAVEGIEGYGPLFGPPDGRFLGPRRAVSDAAWLTAVAVDPPATLHPREELVEVEEVRVKRPYLVRCHIF